MEATHKFLLRLPESLADRMIKKAKTKNRSLNAQIITELQRAVEDTKHEQPVDKLQKGLK